MNLIHDTWIPVIRSDGAFERIAPWQLSDPANPVRQLAAPRADFNGAMAQWLIGLLQTTCTPANPDQWAEWLDQPPELELLRNKFNAVTDAFELAGAGPRFMQDFSLLDTDPVPVSGLLIEAPGGNTTKLNKDLFIKRGGCNAICPACAAMALFTLQTNAPSGGVGHRTGLRGGGPLTTLVQLDPIANSIEPTLWQNIWLNVFDQQQLSSLSGNPLLNEPAAIFPWLAPTRTSESKTGENTLPEDAHPLQMYWSMPRRIRLDFDKLQQGVCDICAAESDELIAQYQTRNYGVNYNGAWHHPLSPYSQPKPDILPLPMHAQPGGISYRHWPGFTTGNGGITPAKIVSAFYGRKIAGEQLILHVFGYDMDNMKARCWYECTLPLFLISDPEVRGRFSEQVDRLIEAATQFAGFVRTCVKEGWFKRPGDVKGDTAFLIESFYQRSESAFYATLDQLRCDLSPDATMALRVRWHKQLCDIALALFEEFTTRGGFEYENPARVANARQKLLNLMHGKKLRADLGLPVKTTKSVKP